VLLESPVSGAHYWSVLPATPTQTRCS